jgi:hypothetical protein
VAVVAEVMPTASCALAGSGAPAPGLKRGVVVSIDATVRRSSRR